MPLGLISAAHLRAPLTTVRVATDLDIADELSVRLHYLS
jgi:hypothetical protein